MDDHATAQALADDAAQPVDSPETTQDEDLGAVYRAIMERDGPIEEAEPPEPEAQEEEQAEPAEPKEAEEPSRSPTFSQLPLAIKKAWPNLPRDAQEAIEQRERHFGEMGRMASGLKPLQDKLVGMVKEFPALANMTSDQVVAEMEMLARINQQFNSDPIGAVMGLIKQHGLEQQFAAAMQGQNQDVGKYIADLKNEISQLRKGLDPNALRQNFDTWQKETTVAGQVEAFAAEHKETWAQVQPHLPAAIQAAKSFLGENASPQDVLSRAYELAETQLGLAKAPAEQAVEQTAPAPDPERAKRAEKAKSVNVAGSKTGTPRALTEEEALTRKYREIAARG